MIAETKEALSKSGVSVDSLEEFLYRERWWQEPTQKQILFYRQNYSPSDEDHGLGIYLFLCVQYLWRLSDCSLTFPYIPEASEARATIKKMAYKRALQVSLNLNFDVY